MTKKLLGWVVVGLVLSGAFLVTSTNNHVRLVGFALWVITNSYWMVYNYRGKEYPLSAQFAACLILAIVGGVNNL